ncbi:MAG: type II toxin-antitoxin system ParD family antitoxin [Pyrinomonadaceae bacterium]
MARIKLTISLPESVEEYVRDRIEAGNYGTASEYFRDLIRREQMQIDKIRFERSLAKQASSPRPLFRDENSSHRY